MNLMHDALAEFSAELYVATLSKIAHSDGLHPAEQEILEQHASQFGIELDALPDVPKISPTYRGRRASLSTETHTC